MWTDAAGRVQPQVTLFDGLFHAENPHLPKLDSAYKALALKMRTRKCDSCHDEATIGDAFAAPKLFASRSTKGET